MASRKVHSGVGRIRETGKRVGRPDTADMVDMGVVRHANGISGGGIAGTGVDVVRQGQRNGGNGWSTAGFQLDYLSAWGAIGPGRVRSDRKHRRGPGDGSNH